jgi:hypothetical protein
MYNSMQKIPSTTAPFSSSIGEQVGLDAESVDEFGRVRQQQRPTAWPRRFEDFGSDYVLDSCSGMFYDANKAFYYDPNSKLYVDKRNHKHYAYDAGQNPPFAPQLDASLATPESLLNLEPILSVAACTNSNKTKPVISIQIKTKSLPTKKKKIRPTMERTSPPKKQNKHAAQLETWTLRKQELIVPNDQPATAAAVAPTPTIKQQVSTTATGTKQPICGLCRRKFATAEKLLHHEQVSQLHKDNLAKQQQLKPATSTATASTATYVDRAQQRRNMHGSEERLFLNSAGGLRSIPQLPITCSSVLAPTPPAQPLGHDHVGRRMLEKLGWSDDQRTKTHEELGREWDRIERQANTNNNNNTHLRR